MIKEAKWKKGDEIKFGISDELIGELVIPYAFEEYADKAHIYKNLFSKIKLIVTKLNLNGSGPGLFSDRKIYSMAEKLRFELK